MRQATVAIGHVGADVEEVFEEPEAREGDLSGFAFPPEIGGAKERDQEFLRAPIRGD